MDSKKEVKLLYILAPSAFVNYKRAGFASRVFRHFEEMSRYFGEIHILSADAQNYSDYLPSKCYHHPFGFLGKKGIPKLDRISLWLFLAFSAFTHSGIYRKCDVYEARYLHGLLPAIIFKCLLKKLIIVWFPWWWAGVSYRDKPIKFKIARWIEKIFFRQADLILVSTEELMKLVR